MSRAMVVAGFTFYDDDTLWTLTNKHRTFATNLMVNGEATLHGQRFILCDELDSGGLVAGVCVVDTRCESVQIRGIEEARERALNALTKAGIIIPASYGINLYLTIDPRENV